MKEQTSAVHYAIALLLGVIGLLIILIFVSLRSQAEFINLPEDETQEVTQEILEKDQETPEVKIEYTDGEGNAIEEGEDGEVIEDNTGVASTSTEEVTDVKVEGNSEIVSSSNKEVQEATEDKK